MYVCAYIYIMKLWMCFLVGLHGFGACTSLQMLTSWWFQMWQKWNFIRPNSGFFPIPSPSLVMHHLFVCKLSYAVAIVFSLTTEKHTVSLCCLRSACCSYSLRPQFLPIQPRLDGCEILHHRKDGWNPQNIQKKWDKQPINWCRISQPSTVSFSQPPRRPPSTPNISGSPHRHAPQPWICLCWAAVGYRRRRCWCRWPIWSTRFYLPLKGRLGIPVQ